MRWATLPNPKPDTPGAFSPKPDVKRATDSECIIGEARGSGPDAGKSLCSSLNLLVLDLPAPGTEGHEVEPYAPEFGPRRELSRVISTTGYIEIPRESLYFRRSPAFVREMRPHVHGMGNRVEHSLGSQRLQFRHMVLTARFTHDLTRNHIALRVEHHIGLNHCGIQYGIQQVRAGAQPDQGSRQHQQKNKQRGQSRVIPNALPDHDHHSTDK